ncbi:MAG TPA: DUF411 domain-containing protein [Chromatiaceae bacterium]|nr:DUF411 domain-containing protein [Chromatiaceae bacterium]
MKKQYSPTFWSMLVLAAGVAAATMAMIATPAVMAAEVVVYKSPTCGCCKKWVQHMRENGFDVEVHEQYNVTPVKNRLGVPGQVRSCHTAKVDGYIIEGHVPADVVKRLLQEKPQVAGLAVPGMPMGSPGMEGFRKDPYNILSFTSEGKTAIYESR